MIGIDGILSFGNRLAGGARLGALGLAALLAFAVEAQAFVLNFDDDDGVGDIVNGQVIDNEFTLANGGVPGTAGSLGVTVSAINGGGGPNLAVAFDSTLYPTQDPDLQDPFAIAPGSEAYVGDLERPGNILIVQENSTGCGDGVCDNPDDEGGGPNKLKFAFTQAVDIERIDVFDIDCWNSSCSSGESATFEFFSDSGFSNSLGTVVVSAFGNRTAKRVFFGTEGQGAMALKVTLSGSGAISNIAGSLPEQQVPTPGTLALLVVGLAGVARFRRRAA